jgi:hypothetical protein
LLFPWESPWSLIIVGWWLSSFYGMPDNAAPTESPLPKNTYKCSYTNPY